MEKSLIIASVLLFSPIAPAALIYDNINASDLGNSGRIISDNWAAGDWEWAMPFTAQSSGTLSRMEGVFSASLAMDITLELYTDNSGQIGSVLDSVTFNVPGGTNNNPAVYGGTTVGTTTLTTGTDYWLVGSGDSGRGTWYRNVQSVMDTWAYRTDGSSDTWLYEDNQTLLAFRVNSTDSGSTGSGSNSQVAEPTTLALMGLGLAGIGFVRRKKRTV